MASFDVEIYYRDGKIRAVSLPPSVVGNSVLDEWTFCFDSIEEGMYLQYTFHTEIKPDEHALDMQIDDRGFPTDYANEFYAKIIDAWEIPNIIRIDYLGTPVFREIGGFLVNLNKIRNYSSLYLNEDYENNLLITIAMLADLLPEKGHLLEEQPGFSDDIEKDVLIADTLGIPVVVLEQAREFYASIGENGSDDAAYSDDEEEQAFIEATTTITSDSEFDEVE